VVDSGHKSIVRKRWVFSHFTREPRLSVCNLNSNVSQSNVALNNISFNILTHAQAIKQLNALMLISEIIDTVVIDNLLLL